MDVINSSNVLEEKSIKEKDDTCTELYKDIEEEDISLASDSFISAKEGYISSGDETEEMEDALVMPCMTNQEKIVSEKSSDGGYGSSSDDEKVDELRLQEEKAEEEKAEKEKVQENKDEEMVAKEDEFGKKRVEENNEEVKLVEDEMVHEIKNKKENTVEENKSVDKLKEKLTSEKDRLVNEYFEKYNYSGLPQDLQTFITGINSGLPIDYSPPIDEKPEWFDEKKYKIGQAFARKYFVGVNVSEMLSLYILFALPDGLETLIFTKNSSTPFTSFKRYLSTVLRVASWYDHDIWDKTTLGYKNIKTVRRMHINVSKKINTTPYEELKTQVTLLGSTNNAPVWSNLKDIVKQDFQASQGGCPFQTASVEKTGPMKVFVNQLDMSTTQWGFMGLMVVYPEKFGAANATREELEGFVHLWRCIGYLLGTEDKYNFCAGTLDEVVERSQNVIDKWVRPNFLNVTEEWEHMSRCLAEGMSYVASPGISFEVSLVYMCYVLDIPAPNIFKTLSWSQTLSFNFLKFMMTVATKYPGVMPLLNLFARKSLAKASAMSSEELKKLEDKKYDYQVTKNEQRLVNTLPVWTARASLLGLLLVARVLI